MMRNLKKQYKKIIITSIFISCCALNAMETRKHSARAERILLEEKLGILLENKEQCIEQTMAKKDMSRIEAKRVCYEKSMRLIRRINQLNDIEENL